MAKLALIQADPTKGVRVNAADIAQPFRDDIQRRVKELQAKGEGMYVRRLVDVLFLLMMLTNAPELALQMHPSWSVCWPMTIQRPFSTRNGPARPVVLMVYDTTFAESIDWTWNGPYRYDLTTGSLCIIDCQEKDEGARRGS
jgi:hypothetical protein